MRSSHTLITAISAFMVILLIGTAFYQNVEGWSLVDSFYFTGITVTTLGYGDIVPKTDTGKIFTVFFAMSSIGVFLFLISNIINNYIQGYIQRTYREIVTIGRSLNRHEPKKGKPKKVKVIVEKRR